jgi:hypothetical protein
VVYLGHFVSADGIRPVMAAILELQPAANQKGMRRFLGMMEQYRRYIPGYALLAAPLQVMMRKSVSLVWSDEAFVSFEALKGALCSAPFWPCIVSSFSPPTGAVLPSVLCCHRPRASPRVRSTLLLLLFAPLRPWPVVACIACVVPVVHCTRLILPAMRVWTAAELVSAAAEWSRVELRVVLYAERQQSCQLPYPVASNCTATGYL